MKAASHRRLGLENQSLSRKSYSEQHQQQLCGLRGFPQIQLSLTHACTHASGDLPIRLCAITTKAKAFFFCLLQQQHQPQPAAKEN